MGGTALFVKREKLFSHAEAQEMASGFTLRTLVCAGRREFAFCVRDAARFEVLMRKLMRVLVLCKAAVLCCFRGIAKLLIRLRHVLVRLAGAGLFGGSFLKTLQSL